MIKVNDYEIIQDKFGDGTLKCECSKDIVNLHDSNTIVWAYDDDSELFTLACINDMLRDLGAQSINLVLPYIPNARQDRFVSGRLFTLKTFCKLINNMNFNMVTVLDPHSAVSIALLDRVDAAYFAPVDNNKVDAIMYPDTGAAKKYQEVQVISKPIIIGNKHRDKEGRIESYELLNFDSKIKAVKIKDDICSYGGTFVAAAKTLREKGVEKIYLEVSHCESNIFEGEVFDYIDEVITTDSIIDLDHKDYEGYTEEKAKKLNIVKIFRTGGNK